MEPHLRAFPIRAAEAAEVDGRWLHTSPEYAIKSTLADIDSDVFTFARSYRDEPPTRWHHPEFTMVEWYRLDAPYDSLMTDCEDLLHTACIAVGVEPPRAAKRLSVSDAFYAHVGVHPDASEAELREAVERHGVSAGDWGWEGLFTLAYAELVEPAIAATQPVFLHSFPARMAALARLNPSDPRFAERFELYVPGPQGPIELANAFGELTDPVEQRERFQRESIARRIADADEYPMPEPLLVGIERLPLTSGIALGFERLLVWLAEHGPGWRTGVADWLLSEPSSGT